MFYLKIVFIALWFLFTSFLSFLFPLAFWRERDINRDYARVLSWGILNGLGIRVEVEGRQWLELGRPVVYVANHQSSFDLATFGGVYPRRTMIIGKKELVLIPLFGWIYFLAGNVLLDRKRTGRAIAGLSEVAEAIKKRRVSIWIFPEGTRNRTERGLMPFKRGAFHVAVQAQVPIVPLVSSSLRVVFSWSERRLVSGVLKVRVLPPISTAGLGIEDVGGLAEKTQSQMRVAFSAIDSGSLDSLGR